MIRVLFVCLGNICRSPMAEAVFRKMVSDRGLSSEISADSCGTSGWHTGERPHKGTMEMLSKYGVPCDNIYSSTLGKEHFDFDYIIAMDKQNLNDINALKPADCTAEISLLSGYADGGWASVPDPWYTGNFIQAYELIAEGCRGLLDYIVKKGAA